MICCTVTLSNLIFHDLLNFATLASHISFIQVSIGHSLDLFVLDWVSFINSYNKAPLSSIYIATCLVWVTSCIPNRCAKSYLRTETLAQRRQLWVRVLFVVVFLLFYICTLVWCERWLTLVSSIKNWSYGFIFIFASSLFIGSFFDHIEVWVRHSKILHL